MRVFYLVFTILLLTNAAIAADTPYTCPMHPHITGEKGNTCPVCGMDLVPRDKDTGQNTDEHDAHGDHAGQISRPDNAIQIKPRYRQALGVKTTQAKHREFGQEIRAYGRIVKNPRLSQQVDVRTSGWIVDLATDAVDDRVSKGDLLFTYYSPELMNAQSDFFTGGGSAQHEQRLRLYGMGDKAIAGMKDSGTAMRATPFYAPQDGTVTELAARQGAYLEKGSTVLRLQDFAHVWVEADVPLRDAQFLKVGTPAQVTLPATGETFETKVDFIHPVTDAQSRTATVRLVLDNRQGKLKPETYVDTRFTADTQKRLAVPAESVLYGKFGAYVIEALGDGYFRPVMVETGITADGWTEITDGLKHGRDIVKTGQFMLDAESTLKGGMAAMDHGASGDDETGAHKHEH